MTAMTGKSVLFPIVLALLLAFALFEVVHLVAPAGSASSWLPLGTATDPSDLVSHPIPRLMSEAETNFRHLIAKQSSSLSAAVAEYRRRYKRSPPKGFDDWYAFAKDNDVKIIDEYDGMVNDLTPFWDLSGEEIRRRVLQVCHGIFRVRQLVNHFPADWAVAIHRSCEAREWQIGDAEHSEEVQRF